MKLLVNKASFVKAGYSQNEVPGAEVHLQYLQVSNVQQKKIQ